MIAILALYTMLSFKNHPNHHPVTIKTIKPSEFTPIPGNTISSLKHHVVSRSHYETIRPCHRPGIVQSAEHHLSDRRHHLRIMPLEKTPSQHIAARSPSICLWPFQHHSARNTFLASCRSNNISASRHLITISPPGHHPIDWTPPRPPS